MALIPPAIGLAMAASRQAVSVPERGFVALIPRTRAGCVESGCAAYAVSVPERGFVALIRQSQVGYDELAPTTTSEFQSPSGDSWL